MNHKKELDKIYNQILDSRKINKATYSWWLKKSNRKDMKLSLKQARKLWEDMINENQSA